MTIKITKKNGYFEANAEGYTPCRSVLGGLWVWSNGGEVVGQVLYDINAAFFAYLGSKDTQPTDDTPPFKVGDWVEVTEDNPNHCKCVIGEKYEVISLVGDYALKLKNIDGIIHVAHIKLTTPPEEPKTYTGDPPEWGPGWYREVNGSWTVLVDITGEWTAIKRGGGAICGINRSVKPTAPQSCTYTRISTNPADAIRWDAQPNTQKETE